jgi:hypothetical protein
LFSTDVLRDAGLDQLPHEGSLQRFVGLEMDHGFVGVELRTKPTRVIQTAGIDSDNSDVPSRFSPPVNREAHSGQKPRLWSPPAALAVKW